LLKLTILTDTKHRAASLQQQSYLLSIVAKRLVIKPQPQSGALRDGTVLLFAYANLATYSFVRRQGVLVGHWPEWPHSAIVLAAVSGRSAAGSSGPRVSQMFSPSWKILPPWNLFNMV